jgi:hypothetical protein
VVVDEVEEGEEDEAVAAEASEIRGGTIAEGDIDVCVLYDEIFLFGIITLYIRTGTIAKACLSMFTINYYCVGYRSTELR